MQQPVIILGSKGLGKVAMEIFLSNDVSIYCFLDDDVSLHKTMVHDIPILGSIDDDGFLKYIGKKCEAFVAVDETIYRKKTVDMLIERRKVMPVNAIHKQAIISRYASFGHGNLINAGVVINTGARIESHCIIHSHALVDYDAQVGDFAQIGAGSIINAGVVIEKGAFIGTGVTLIAGIKIGKNARVGAGSVVVADVKENSTVFGYPAEEVKK